MTLEIQTLASDRIKHVAELNKLMGPPNLSFLITGSTKQKHNTICVGHHYNK
jgi:hypothetical protein